MMYPGNGPYTPYTPYTPYPYPASASYGAWKSAEQAAANAEPAPDAGAARGFWSGRFGTVLAIVTVVVTVAAIVLAVVAAPVQAVQSGSTPPGGYTLVYDASPLDNGAWMGGTGVTGTEGCAFTAQGLDVTGGADGSACLFQPSANADLTSQGFWIQATIAPAAYVQNAEVPLILIGDNEPVLFDSAGAYVIDCHNDSTTCAAGTTTAWHTNAFVANTITVSYDAGTTMLTVFANGQLVTGAPLTQGAQPTLALGAGGDGEAIFTHVSIYSASASASLSH